MSVFLYKKSVQVKVYHDCRFIQTLLKPVKLNISQKDPKELVVKQMSML